MSRGSAQSFTLPGASASANSKVGHSSRTAKMSRCSDDRDLPMSTNLDLPGAGQTKSPACRAASQVWTLRRGRSGINDQTGLSVAQSSNKLPLFPGLAVVDQTFAVKDATVNRRPRIAEHSGSRPPRPRHLCIRSLIFPGIRHIVSSQIALPSPSAAVGWAAARRTIPGRSVPLHLPRPKQQKNASHDRGRTGCVS
jgi:hypothetical protein